MHAPQIGTSTPSANQYRERILGFLADRDPFDVMASTAARLVSLVRNYPVVVLRARPFEGKWTANEVIGHLTDSEWVYGYRLRRILCEETPDIRGTDQDLWVARQNHNDREPSELVEVFSIVRDLNLDCWKRVSPSDFDRAGQHNERGSESLGMMLRMMAGHDLSHLAQIDRCLAAARHTR